MYKIILACALLMLSIGCSKTKKATAPNEEKSTPETALQKPPTFTKTPIAGMYSIVSGTVKDDNGDLMPFVLVKLESKSGPPLAAQTDMDGKFQIKNIPKGEYTISLNNVGYEPQNFGPIKLDEALEIHFNLLQVKPIEVILLKPIIYLYPEDTVNVHVQLDYQGQLMHTYPRCGADGWRVTATPDGTLTDNKGRQFYALYWEGSQQYGSVPDCGQVVAADQTIPFLEKTLDQLGLSQREANEFIMYWLPQLEKNPYNLIHFATTAYDKEVPLLITPQPDQMIRIMMTMVPLQQPIAYPMQWINKTHNLRKGFCVVEWGGQIMDSHLLIDHIP